MNLSGPAMSFSKPVFASGVPCKGSDLAELGYALQSSTRDPKIRAMLGELADRYQRDPEKEHPAGELGTHALRMSTFPRDTRERAQMGKAALEFLALRTATGAAATLGIQAAAAVTYYDSEWGLCQAVLKDASASGTGELARLGLAMMKGCVRVDDQARVGELVCKTLAGQEAARKALDRCTGNRTYNQDAEIFQQALQDLIQAPPQPVLAAAPALSLVERLEAETNCFKAADRARELLSEAGADPARAPLAELGLAMLDSSHDPELKRLIARSLLADMEQGRNQPLQAMDRAGDLLEKYLRSPRDKAAMMTAALRTLKSRPQHEPVASMALSAADFTLTYLTDFYAVRAGVAVLAADPRPTPAQAAAQVMDRVAGYSRQGGSRVGQAALSFIKNLSTSEAVTGTCEAIEQRIADSPSYDRDLVALREGFAQLDLLPEASPDALLATARAAAGAGDPAAASVGETQGKLLVGGVALKVRRRAWEPPDQPSEREVGASHEQPGERQAGGTDGRSSNCEAVTNDEVSSSS